MVDKGKGVRHEGTEARRHEGVEEWGDGSVRG